MKRTLLRYLALALLLGAAGEARAGLVALYQFNDPSNLGLDSSGNGNTAVNNGGVAFNASGFQGGAASFDGVNDFFRVNVDVGINAKPRLTWGAWVKPAALAPTDRHRVILSNDDANFDRTLDIDDRTDPPHHYAAFRGGPPNRPDIGVLDSDVVPSTTSWTFIAAAYDQNATTMTLYVDNQSFTSATQFNPTSHAFFEIGRNPSFGFLWKGLIDNVFVYDQALTAAEITDIRNNGFPTAVPEPSSLCLLVLGGMGLSGYAWRKWKMLVTAAPSSSRRHPG